MSDELRVNPQQNRNQYLPLEMAAAGVITGIVGLALGLLAVQLGAKFAPRALALGTGVAVLTGAVGWGLARGLTSRDDSDDGEKITYEYALPLEVTSHQPQPEAKILTEKRAKELATELFGNEDLYNIIIQIDRELPGAYTTSHELADVLVLTLEGKNPKAAQGDYSPSAIAFRLLADQFDRSKMSASPDTRIERAKTELKPYIIKLHKTLTQAEKLGLKVRLTKLVNYPNSRDHLLRAQVHKSDQPLYIASSMIANLSERIQDEIITHVADQVRRAA